MTSPYPVDEFMATLAHRSRREIDRYVQVVLDIDMFGALLSSSASAQRADGTWMKSDLLRALDEVLGIVETEKSDAYAKGRGTWFHIRVTFAPATDPVVERFWDDPPGRLHTALDIPPSTAAVQAELVIFPRTPENIPRWMRERLAADDLDVPYLDLATDEIVMGSDREAYEAPVLHEEQKSSPCADHRSDESAKRAERNRRASFFQQLTDQPIYDGVSPDRSYVERVPDTLWETLRPGDYDQLLVDAELDAWPALVDALADDVFRRMVDEDRRELPRGILAQPDDPDAARSAIRYDVGRRFWFVNWAEGLALARPYYQACADLYRFGWVRELSRMSRTRVAVFTTPDSDLIEVDWLGKHLQVTLHTGVGVRNVRHVPQLFVLSNDNDRLIAVDGPPPAHSDVLPDRVAALETALKALRELVRPIDSMAYQKSMREAHEG